MLMLGHFSMLMLGHALLDELEEIGHAPCGDAAAQRL
jgi:hypothetical protein